jgi:uncharacterized protein (DUF2062 family)
MKRFLKRKFVDPVVGFLKQGISPERLAWAVSIGIILAIIPVFGASTLLCLGVIACFRLNPAVLFLANQFAYPLQFVLYFPFIRTGVWLFNAKPLPLSLTQIFQLFDKSIIQAIQQLWWATLYGIAIWMIVSLPLAWVLQLLLKKLFTKIESHVNGVSA